MSATPEPTNVQEPDGLLPETTLRRSSRRSKPSARAEQAQERADSEIPVDQLTIHVTSPRRNPKRKASEATKSTVNLPDNLLEEALSPLQQQDIEEWEGWIELESEPAFFNIILKDLGVENVKAQEVFSIDQDSLDLLPKPVHGLVFLYQYLPEEDENGEESDANDVWFANQTTPNACATVALLNIVMNADVRLGTRLQEFKDSTKDLCTAVRGHRLSTDPFIRTIHNSFTRRMNQLNADLCLENEADEAASSQTRKRAAPKKSRPRPRKKKALQYGFHFVAYVNVNQSVWELDGLKSKPHLVGMYQSRVTNSLDDAVQHILTLAGTVPAEAGDWMTIAQPQIQARMLQYEGTQLSFNLIALCQSPLSLYSQSIAEALAAWHFFREKMANNDTLRDLVSTEPFILSLDNEVRLTEFGLTKSDVVNATVPQSLTSKLADPELNVKRAYELFQQLTVNVKAAIREYRSEIFAIEEEEKRVKGRKKDYGPALHKWVQKLADKGVLEEVIKTSM